MSAKLEVFGPVDSDESVFIRDLVYNAGFGGRRATAFEANMPHHIVSRSSRKQGDWFFLFDQISQFLSNQGFPTDFSVTLSGSFGDSVVVPELENIPFVSPGDKISVSFTADYASSLLNFGSPFTNGTITGKLSSGSGAVYTLDHPFFTGGSRTAFGKVLTGIDEYSPADVFSSITSTPSSALSYVSSWSYHALVNNSEFKNDLSLYSGVEEAVGFAGSVTFSKWDLAQFIASGVTVFVYEPDAMKLPYAARLSSGGDVHASFSYYDNP